MKIYLTENQITKLQTILLEKIVETKKKLEDENEKKYIIELCNNINKCMEIMAIIETCKNMQ